MDSPRPAGVMPLRPLTFGELLDAAVALLRANAAVVLVASLVLAAAEQGVLYLARVNAGLQPPDYQPYSDQLGVYWLILSLGMGTEAVVLTLLGSLTGAAAAPALMGRPLRATAVLRAAGRRIVPVLVLAALVGELVAIGALAAFIPWIFLYGLTGLAMPALIIEKVGPGKAFRRGMALGSRQGMRATWVRLAAYVAWLCLRLVLGYGGIKLLALFVPVHPGWVTISTIAAWLVANTVAYAMLASVDAVLYLETRMRTEGLDIAIGRDLSRRKRAGLAVHR